MNYLIKNRFEIVTKDDKNKIIGATLLNVEHLHIIVITDKNKRLYSTSVEAKQAIGQILFELAVDYTIHQVDESEIQEYIKNLGNVVDIDVLDFKYLNDQVCRDKIIDSPFKYYDHIAEEFRPYMNKKIVISGIESSGKTELAKKLSLLLNAGFSKEWGRYHHLEYMGGEEIYAPNEFVSIMVNQLKQDKDVNMTAQRLIILDTDPIVTLRFLQFYREYYIEHNLFNEEFEREYLSAYELCESICNTYKVDMVYLLKPATFVQDGMRTELSEDDRYNEYIRLRDLYTKFNIHFVEVEFNNDYESRFYKVYDDVIKLLELK